jgi:isoquinoline 1-oxidoreductase subunit beta
MATATGELSRRTFISGMAAASGGLLLGFRIQTADGQAPALGAVLAPNAFVRVPREGKITVILPYVEMGQGAYTSQAQIFAEELDVEIDQLALEHAPPDEKLYGHPVFVDQITGGSAGLRGSWETLRHAGAAARTMLVAAAAERWNVPSATCSTRSGEVTHAPSGRKASYGELADSAARLPVPQTVPLKRPSDYRVIGKSVKRVDTPGKVNGTAKFGIDAAPPGVKLAAVAACPVFGGTLESVDDRKARAIRGVRQIVKLDDTVAVVADHTWAARKGLALLEIRWREGANASFDSARAVAQCDAALSQPGVVAGTKGNVAAAEVAAVARYEADFRLPILAHMAMEPLNCTVHIRKGECEIWTGCQRLAMARRMAAEACGLPVEKVTVHNHLLGGGFGRRLEADYVAQAVRIARHVEGPVKVIWSREEDIQHDYFRYLNHSRVRVGLDAHNNPVSFFHRLVGPAVMARWMPAAFKDGVDLDIISVATGSYEWPNHRIEYVRHEPPQGMFAGNWRGVGASRNAFIIESVIDDLAHAAKRDPLEYRRSLLANNPRALAVLEIVARTSRWGTPMPPGSGRGLAFLEDFGSLLALVAEVIVDRSGRVRVIRLVSAIDCGLAVNPDIVKAQIEGGIVYGLSAALYGRITVANGRVQQSNFDDCPVVRMRETPPIDVHLVPSTEAPGGVGEPGTAILFPALTNAIFAATGKRLFELPIDATKLRSA